jgi:prepilin-type processing-associated H-X9-DG protein
MTTEDQSSWCFIGLTNWHESFWGGTVPTIIAHRHNDGMNIAFCDGHAKWYKTSAAPATYNYNFQDITFDL